MDFGLFHLLVIWWPGIYISIVQYLMSIPNTPARWDLDTFIFYVRTITSLHFDYFLSCSESSNNNMLFRKSTKVRYRVTSEFLAAVLLDIPLVLFNVCKFV